MIWHGPVTLGLGLGLRGPHLAQWLRDPPAQVQWLEAITDNYLINRGWLRRTLLRLAEIRPVVLHGVGLNIGSVDSLDRAYLRQIKQLAAEVRAPWVSDHLCWTGVGGLQSHDLLPMPYTDEALRWLVQRVRQVQDALERPLVLENPSSYLAFQSSTWTEWAFVAELCERADCGLLLDVNNVHVSAHNHRYSEQDWLAAVPWHRVWQLHVAGHTDYATHKLDTHIGPVPEAVWRLYGQAWSRSGGRSTLLEWDDEIPDLAVAAAELCKARAWQTEPCGAPDRPERTHQLPRLSRLPALSKLEEVQRAVMAQIASGKPNATVRREVLATDRLAAEARVAIHADMYRVRLDSALAEDFPKTAQLMGERAFAAACAGYRNAHPAHHGALEAYGAQFAAWLATRADGVADASELARLEWAVVQTRLAPFSEPLPPDWASRLGGAALVDCSLRFAAGARAMAISAQIHQHWFGESALRRRGCTVRLSPAGRHVAVRAMARPEAALFRRLKEGSSLGRACQAVAARSPGWAAAVHANLGAWLQAWVTDGAVVGVNPVA